MIVLEKLRPNNLDGRKQRDKPNARSYEELDDGRMRITEYYPNDRTVSNVIGRPRAAASQETS